MKNFFTFLLCVILSLSIFCGCSFSPVEFIVDTALGSETTENNTKIDATVVAPATVDKSNKHLAYSTLNETQQNIYAVLLAAANDMVTGWIEMPSCSDNFENDIMKAIYALDDDRPEMFWIDTKHLIRSVKSGNKTVIYFAFEVKEENDSCSYLCTKSERDDMLKTLNNKVQELVTKTKDLNRFEAELYINDYLCDNIVYDESDKSLCYTSYGALINGKAVCSGYSKAAKLIFDKIGIENVLCHGKSRNESHVWNLVNLNNAWYHLDITWNDDDQNKFRTYKYFNTTINEIKKDHEIFPLHDINSGDDTENKLYNYFNFDAQKTDLNYYTYYGLELLNDDYLPLAKAICEDFAKNKKYTSFIVRDKTQLKGFESEAQESVSFLQNAIIHTRHPLFRKMQIREYYVIDNIILLKW